MPRHIMFAIKKDKELDILFRGCQLRDTGVVPNSFEDQGKKKKEESEDEEADYDSEDNEDY